MKTILVIDDDDEERNIVGQYLESKGYLCTLAPSAAAARTIIGKKKFGVILSDMHMPGESGLDFMKWALPRNPKTTGIIMSGLMTSDIEEKAAVIGVLCCMEKPVSTRLLLEKLAKASGQIPWHRISA